MKIVLVTLGSETGGCGFIQPIVGVESLGVHLLASILIKNMFEVTVVDGLALGLGFNDVLSRTLAANPDVVAISPSLAVMSETLTLARKLKELHNSPFIVLGGHHATLCSQQIIDNEPDIDYIIEGEAENSFILLLEAIKDKSLYELPRIISSGSIADLPVLGTKNLDTLPWVNRGTLWELKQTHDIVGANIQTSRNCPYNCSFCTTPVFYKSSNLVRRRNPIDVVDEIEWLCKNLDIHLINFVDDIFLTPSCHSKKWSRLFAQEMTKRKLPVRFAAMFRAEMFRQENREQIDSLVEAGLHRVLVGFENVNTDSLALFNKGTSVDDYFLAIDYLESKRVFLAAAFICLNPHSTFASTRHNVRFLEETVNDPVFYHYISQVLVFPGTALEAELRKQGLLIQNDHPYIDGYGYTFETPGMRLLANAFAPIQSSAIQIDRTLEEIQFRLAYLLACESVTSVEHDLYYSWFKAASTALASSHSSFMKTACDIAEAEKEVELKAHVTDYSSDILVTPGAISMLRLNADLQSHLVHLSNDGPIRNTRTNTIKLIHPAQEYF